MNQEAKLISETETRAGGQSMAYLLGGLGAFLVIAAMVWVVRHYAAPAPIGVEKTALREKNLKEIRSAGIEALTNYAVIDPAKGIVRIPIAEAMKLVETEFKNPAAGRAGLLERAAKANAVPPKPPEKPSQFE